MTGRIGVAISTTGDMHRLDLLERCVAAWCAASNVHSLFVTVDGSATDAERVAAVVQEHTGSVFQVGQPHVYGPTVVPPKNRYGVAVNKNTGIELLMDNTDVEHLFLCDDDTWPRFPQSLNKHTDLELPHSMVAWGRGRLESPGSVGGYTTWTWPRGVMLYTHRTAVEIVGGMDERFGPGGHEHVEWSQRIHNAGLTPAPFCSPASYATRDGMGARALWHAEDMPHPGEPRHVFAARKKRQTSINTTREDWANIDKIMAAREGSQDFVPYQANENGRTSATLCEYTPSRGAGEA